MEPTILESATRPNAFIKRISWPAIFAGVIVVLITQFMLSLLGIAFGAGSIDPLQEKHPLAGLGIGSAVWFGITTILALFAGGWVAARLAAMPDRTESSLHGVLTWGVSTLALAYLVTSTVGGALSGAAGIVGKAANVVGQGAKAIAPQITQAVSGEFGGEDGITWNEIKAEAATLLKQTKKNVLQPKALASSAQAIGKDAKAAAGDMASAPESADAELSALWNKIESRGEKVLEAADKEALINVLVARTSLNKAEAAATVDQWQKTMDEAKARFATFKADAEKKLRQAADSTAAAVSKVAAWSFVGLLLGLSAAVAGGYLGSPFRGATFGKIRRLVVPQEAAA